MDLKTFLGLSGILLAIVLIAQNLSVTTFNIFFWKMTMSKSVLVILCFLLGLGSGIFLAVKKGKEKDRN